MSEKQEQVPNEQIILQKMTQFSPFQRDQTETLPVSSNIDDLTEEENSMITMNFDYIPEYLCNTNPSFENKIKSILPTTIKLEELRDIAILIHKIASIKLSQSLWLMYQKSGMGNLPMTSSLLSSSFIETNQIDINVWPKEVRSLLKDSKKIYTNKDHVCLMSVNCCFNDLNMKRDQYRQELKMKTSRLRNFSRHLEDNIEKFIQQNLQTLRMETDGNIAMVQYNYTDEILHRAFLAQIPNENQMKIMKRLCKLKSDQELTKYEVNLLKEKISSLLTSHSFERESIAQLSLINSITTKELQKQFYKQFKDVAVQARMKMMINYMECAEGQKQQSQQQYDNEMKEIQRIQALNSSMWHIIQQRLANISARVECLYKFKTELFRLQSNNH